MVDGPVLVDGYYRRHGREYDGVFRTRQRSRVPVRRIVEVRVLYPSLVDSVCGIGEQQNTADYE